MEMRNEPGAGYVCGETISFSSPFPLPAWLWQVPFLTLAFYLAGIACLAPVFPCGQAPPNPPFLAITLLKQLSSCHTQWVALAGTGFPHSVGGLSWNQRVPQWLPLQRAIPAHQATHSSYGEAWKRAMPGANPGHHICRTHTWPHNQPCRGLTPPTNTPAAVTAGPGRWCCYDSR